MINPVTVPLGIDRGWPRRLRIAFRGIDLTDAAMHAQIRLTASAPGDPIVNLPKVPGFAVTGLRLADVSTTAGVVTSIVDAQLAAMATGNGANLLPASNPECGTTALAWDVFVGLPGRTQERWITGAVTVTDVVTREGDLPALADAPLPGAPDAIIEFDAASYVLDLIAVDLVAELVSQAQAARDGAVIALGEVADAAADALAQIDALVAPRTGDRALEIFSPIAADNSQGAISVTADGLYSGPNGANTLHHAVLTAAQIAAGTVFLDMVASNVDVAMVQQNAAGAEVVAAVLVPITNGRAQMSVALNAATRQIYVRPYAKAGGGVWSGPSITLGRTVDVEKAGDFYAALGRQAALSDGPSLVGSAKFISASVGGSVDGTLNIDGTITIPAGSTNNALFDIAPDVDLALTDTLVVLIEIVAGTLSVDRPSLSLIAPNNTASASIAVDRYLGQSPAMIASFPASAGGRFPSVLSLRAVAGPAAVTLRVKLYKGALPAQPNVPAATRRFLAAAVESLPLKRVVADQGPVRASLWGDGDAVVNVDQNDFLLDQGRDARFIAMTKIVAGKAVAPGGDDSHAGTLAQPMATYAAAVAATPAGAAVGLHNDAIHKISTPGSPRQTRDVIGYGSGSRPAIVDARLHVANGWVQQSDGRWEKVITNREVTKTSDGQPVSLGNTQFKLWRDLTHLVWCNAGNSIAANRAAALASPVDAYEVHKEGSAVSNASADAPATDYRWSLYLKDGKDPNTLDMSIADQDLVMDFGFQDASNIWTIGGAGKDHTHTAVELDAIFTDARMPVLRNHRSLGVHGHGHVGACCTEGFIEAEAAPGGGFSVLNLYPGARPNQDSTHDVVRSLGGFPNILYGHASANPNTYVDYFFRNLLVKRVECFEECDIAAHFDPRGGGPHMKEKAVIDRVLLDYVSTGVIGFSAEKGTYLNGGYANFRRKDGSGLGSGACIVTADQPTEYFVSNFKWKFFAQGSGIGACLIQNGVGNAAQVPTVTFTNCEDLSDPQFKIGMTQSPTGQFCNLIFDACGIGDLDPGRFGYLPRSLIVRAGTEFGYGGKTRDEMRTFLDSQGVEHDISNNTTVRTSAGNVIERPGA